MSTHTWVYLNANKVPNDLREELIKSRLKELELWWGFGDDVLSEKNIKRLEKTFHKLAQEKKLTVEEYIKSLIEQYRTYQRNLINNGWKEYVSQMKKCGFGKIIEKNKSDYVLIQTDMPFRCYVSNKEFLTKESLMDFINNECSDEKIKYYDADTQTFITGKSQKLCEVINDMYETYGDNLLIQFA